MKKMPSSSDVIIMPPQENNRIPHYKMTVPVNFNHFYIIDEIGEPDAFLDLIHTLKTAEEHDTIFIHLNTPGGNLFATIQIISAIRQCSGNVVTCLEGEVCSAGTMLFLSGHKYVVNPNCSFMIHTYSSWFGGKGSDLSARMRHFEEYFKKVAYDIYSDFLTDQEIAAMLEGKDYWMDSDEVLRRLEDSEHAESVNDVAKETLDHARNGSADTTTEIVPKKKKAKAE